MAQIKYNLGNVKSEVNYSTDEQVIGTWINGKPEYRKVVVIDNPSNGMAFSIANIDEPINASWTQVYANTGVYFSYNSDSSSTSIIYFNVTSKNFVVQMGGAFSGKMVVTIEYTKTTDA